MLELGTKKRWHFAHKHRGNRSIDSELPELLEARAVLYSLLRSKFGTAVTLEKRIEGSGLPRVVDCWFRVKGRPDFAYWIIPRQIRKADRNLLRDAFDDLDVSIQSRSQSLLAWSKAERDSSRSRMVRRSDMGTDRQFETQSSWHEWQPCVAAKRHIRQKERLPFLATDKVDHAGY